MTNRGTIFRRRWVLPVSGVVLVLFAAGTQGPVSPAPAAAPSISAAGALNAASLQPGLAAATWITVFGTDLARTTRSWTDADFTGRRLPIALDGVSVLVGDRHAYLSYISPTQINFLSPDATATGTVQLQVISPDGTSPAVSAEMTSTSPALFAWTVQGRQYAAAVRDDGVLIGDPVVFGNTAMRPAAPGDRLMLYGTGFGPSDPPREAALIPDPAPLRSPVAIRIGGVSALVSYAGLVMPGTDQFNVVVPDLPTGEHAVLAESAGQSTQPQVFLSVQGASAPDSAAIIADHTVTDLNRVPASALRAARQTIRMYYGHTSHGSQITNGMTRLESQLGAAYQVAVGEQLPTRADAVNIFDVSTYDWNPDFSGTVARTLAANPSINVVMYMWCGQHATTSWQSVLDGYLADMQALEKQYPKITFVYATGNAQEKDCPGCVRHQFNQQLRQFARQNRKVLFDFGDLDAWYNGDQATYAIPNWCGQYQCSPGAIIPCEHPHWGGGDYNNPCGHATWESCDNKAKAMWWLLARIAGWDGVSRQ